MSYPIEGDTISQSEINYDIMDYLHRTNRVILITLNDGKELQSGVTKCYNELSFGVYPNDINKRDISLIKILK